MRRSNAKQYALPDFLLIGVAKAGTSWIFEILREHPGIYVPVAKDIMFFDRYYDKGLDWYSRFFQAQTPREVSGELSHDYYLSAVTAQRIRDALPKVKLLCCLREPVDKLLSAYLYNKSTGHANMSFDEYVDFGGPREHDKSVLNHFVQVSIARQVEYLQCLRNYYDLFPREHILILFYEDLKADPQAFARQIYSFLEVDSDFVPPSLHKITNPARVARNEPIAHAVYRVAQTLRRLGLANFVGTVKRNPAFNALLYRPRGSDMSISQEAKRRVYERYRSTYEELEQLIGKPLPAEWYQWESARNGA